MAKRKSLENPTPAKEADEVLPGMEIYPGLRVRSICSGHTSTLGEIEWSPCGRYAASPSDDGTVRIWDTNLGECCKVLDVQPSSFNAIAWSKDGTQIAISDSEFGINMCRVTRTPSGIIARIKLYQRHQVPNHLIDSNQPSGLGTNIQSIVWSPDGSTIAFGTRECAAIFFDFPSGTFTQTPMSCHAGFKTLRWLKDGRFIAVGQASSQSDTVIIDARSGFQIADLGPNSRYCFALSLSQSGNTIALSGNDNVVRLFDTDTANEFHQIEMLERTSIRSRRLGFSADDRFLIIAIRGRFIFWDMIDSVRSAIRDDRIGRPLGVSKSCIATTIGDQYKFCILDLDFARLLTSTESSATVRHTSAKIALLGDSNVGKSCLAMRLAEDRYPDDHEHGTTHGMRFWPMEASDLHTSAKAPKGQRRDVILWDFGGQNEYQLVHQLFLRNTTLALVLIDPTRGTNSLNEARAWDKRIEKHFGKDNTLKLLVGAKVDRPSQRNFIDLNSIETLKEECGFVDFVDVSALKNRNIKKLRKTISDLLDWDCMTKTDRPELLQYVRDDIERRRRKNDIVLMLDSLKKSLKRSVPKLYEDTAVDEVTDQLARQGLIVRTRLTSEEEALVLQLPIIEQYAGSIIIAARNNPRGVPMLEERLFGVTKSIELPGMTKKQRLSYAKERIVLECIIELMIQAGICFRHGGLLVFPTLFPVTCTKDDELAHGVSLSYDFTGATDNIYASLVSKLMVSKEFGEGRLESGLVEFERGGNGICGIRRIERHGGLAHIDLFFSDNVESGRRELFTLFVEEHLKLEGIDIQEYEAITCKCGEEISDRIVRENIDRGEADVICPICRNKTLIGEGVDRIRNRDPATNAKMIALRNTIDENLAIDIKTVKKMVAGKSQTKNSEEPIRILHLSDLHFSDKTNTETMLKLLLQDIRSEEKGFPSISTVEYLVVSGDMTDKGTLVGFEKAREFVEKLVGELKLSFDRCIFVPGNHDVHDRDDAYEKREDESGQMIRVRHQTNFPKRFEPFSDYFVHKLLLKPYPLTYEDQGIPYLFPETGIQFLTLNSAWNIDKYGRDRASVHPDAVASVITRADEEVKQAISHAPLTKNQSILRIGVWHHPLAGEGNMQNIDFMSQLQKANMQLCLHGDAHKAKAELFGHRHPGIDVEIIGAGSFGSDSSGRPESTPRLYNVLEIERDPKSRRHERIRVHTRQQKTARQAWEGWYAWPESDGGRLAYYDINLPSD